MSPFVSKLDPYPPNGLNKTKKEYLIPAGEEKHKWLSKSLAELERCSDEAIEEGVGVLSEVALKKSRKVIKCLSEFEGKQPDIYPMQGIKGGDIVIDLYNYDREDRVLMIVESNGSGVLHFYKNGEGEYERIPDAENLPEVLKKIRESSVKTGRFESA